MDYYDDIKKYIELLDSRLNCDLIISKDKANKLVDYLIDNIIDGISSEWLSIEKDNLSLLKMESDIQDELNGDIIIISKSYDDKELYCVENLFKYGNQLGSASNITFVDDEISDKLDFVRIDSEEIKIIK